MGAGRRSEGQEDREGRGAKVVHRQRRQAVHARTGCMGAGRKSERSRGDRSIGKAEGLR